jgi:hypothetical protein
MDWIMNRDHNPDKLVSFPSIKIHLIFNVDSEFGRLAVLVGIIYSHYFNDMITVGISGGIQ